MTFLKLASFFMVAVCLGNVLNYFEIFINRAVSGAIFTVLGVIFAVFIVNTQVLNYKIDNIKTSFFRLNLRSTLSDYVKKSCLEILLIFFIYLISVFSFEINSFTFNLNNIALFLYVLILIDFIISFIGLYNLSIKISDKIVSEQKNIFKIWR